MAATTIAAEGEVAQVSTGDPISAPTTVISTFSSKNKRWAVVAPWIAKLRAVAETHLVLNCARRPVVFVHALQSKCDDESWPGHLVQYREAMKLLGMIGAVDNLGGSRCSTTTLAVTMRSSLATVEIQSRATSGSASTTGKKAK